MAVQQNWIVINFGTPLLINLEPNRISSRQVASGAKICAHAGFSQVVVQCCAALPLLGLA